MKGVPKMSSALPVIQRNLYVILLGFLAIGLYYPAVGIAAIVCMLAPAVFAPSLGRHWCGNYCPRGSFFDRLIARISRQAPVPALLRSTAFRIFAFAALMSFFSWQMVLAWGDWNAVGLVFVRLILATTLVGIILGVFYHQRAWCHFCPMGSVAKWLSSSARPLTVQASCVNCGVCAKVCPMRLNPAEARGSGNFTDRDCLKCALCVTSCPKKAIAA